MEARTKIIAAVAVIMMCAAGLVGAGYAYTASTINDDNNVSSEYVKLTQAGPGAYKFAPTASNLEVYYDSINYTNASTFAYRLADTRTPLDLNQDSTNDFAAVKLGETIHLDATDVGRAHANLACTFTTDGFTYNATYKLVLKITSHASAGDHTVYRVMTGDDGVNETWDNNTFTIEYDSTQYADLTVEVYYGYAYSSATARTAGSGTIDGWVAAEPNATPINNATITFSAAVLGNNQLTLNKNLIEVNTGAAAQVITASLFGFKAEAGTITGDIAWTTSSDAVATVAGSGDNKTTGTVTIVGAGTATITATFTSDGVDYVATCIVVVTAA